MKNNEPIDWDKVTVEGMDGQSAPVVETAVDAVDPAFAETVIAENAKHQNALAENFDENAERASELGQAIKAALAGEMSKIPEDLGLAEAQARIAKTEAQSEQMIGGMIKDSMEAQTAHVGPEFGLDKVKARIEGFKTMKESEEQVAEARNMQKQYQGVAEFALAQKDVPAFQEAFIQLSEAMISERESAIMGLDASFESGEFLKNYVAQNPGMAESADLEDYVKGVYEYQRQSQLDQIENIRKYSIELVQQDPEAVIGRTPEYTKAFGGRPDYVLIDLMNEAKMFQDLEEKAEKEGGFNTYGNFTAQLNGAVEAALKSGDYRVRDILKSVGRTIKQLPPELKQQIDALQ